MAINWTSDIQALYAGQVASDAAYQAPGTYGIPANYINSTNEQELLTLIEVLRAYFANITSAREAKLAGELLLRMVRALQLGGGTYSAANNATRAQTAAMRFYAAHQRDPNL